VALRWISARHGQATAGERSRSEDARLPAATAAVAAVDRRRLEVIELFKTDLGITA
jgi:hypothetical protein